MAYRSRSARRLTRQTRYNLLASIIIGAALIFITLNFILPNLVNGVSKIKNLIKKPAQIKEQAISKTSDLAPPVIFIPYEATNSSRIDIRGFGTAGSKIRIFVDDNQKSETDVGTDGSFVAKNIELNLGTNSIYGKSVDDKNLESLESKTIKLTFDREKPNLAVSEPEDGKKTPDKKIKVSGKTEKDAKVFINDVQVITNPDGGFTKDQPLNDGDNMITIKAVDSASNSAEISRKVTVQP